MRKSKGLLRNPKQIPFFATTNRKEQEKYIQTVNEALKTDTVSATNVLSFML